MKKIDFLAVGDTVTDAFIRIKEAKVHCNIKNEDCELCVKFGDKIPYEFVAVVKAVGNSANAAVAASRLGLNSYLLSNVGNDENGKDCIKELKRNKVNTKYFTVNKGMETNYHYVLWYENERTIMVKHQEYPYHFPNIEPPKYMYLSSLANNSYEYHLEIEKYLKKNPKVKLAFQPGTFQMKLGYEKLKGIYERTELFFVNVEEAQRILETKESDIKKILSMMHEKGPKIIIVTDGPKGSYVYDGKDYWFMPSYPDVKPPYERTGAGDAFSSTFTAVFALGHSIEESLMYAPVNSMSVVQKIGAQKGLLSQEEILEYLNKAPADYKPRKI